MISISEREMCVGFLSFLWLRLCLFSIHGFFLSIAKYGSAGAAVYVGDTEVRVGVSYTLQKDVAWEFCRHLLLKFACSKARVYVTGTFGDVMVCHGVQRIFIFVYVWRNGDFGAVCKPIGFNGTCGNWYVY